MLNAATLLGTPPAGDFQLSARVSVDFQTQYDAGVLLLWIDEQHWAKFCFEFSPASQPMVVSVVTREVSDDANAFVVPDRSVWLRVSRVDGVYAYHASTDATMWQLVRVFSLGNGVADHQIGFEVQSPTGDGCTVAFDQIHFSRTTPRRPPRRLLNIVVTQPRPPSPSVIQPSGPVGAPSCENSPASAACSCSLTSPTGVAIIQRIPNGSMIVPIR